MQMQHYWLFPQLRNGICLCYSKTCKKDESLGLLGKDDHPNGTCSIEFFVIFNSFKGVDVYSSFPSLNGSWVKIKVKT